jgi:Domain of unknown function (DUF4157)
MAEALQVARPRPASRQPAAPEKAGPPAAAAAAPEMPGYLQRKPTHGVALDPYEREADQVGTQLARRAQAGVPAVPPEIRTLAPGTPAAPQRKAEPMAEPVDDDADERAQTTLPEPGPCHPLPPGLRRRMESALGRPLGHVRIHTDAAADALCRAMNAQAVTQGRDIYFAQAGFDPGSEAGLELLGHELVHVVQQRHAAPRPQRKALDRSGAEPDNTASAGAAYRALCTALVTASKTRHRGIYRRMAQRADQAPDKLRRARGRNVVRRTAQVENWTAALAPRITADAVATALRRKRFAVPDDASRPITMTIDGRTTVEGTTAQLAERLMRPDWDRRGVQRELQVDHKVEYQIASQWAGVDTVENFELLDRYLNGSSGSTLMNDIRGKVAAFLQAADPRGREVSPRSPRVPSFLARYDIEFDEVGAAPGGDAIARQVNNGEGNWTQEQIADLDPLDRARQVLPPAAGNATTLVLSSGRGGFELTRLAHGSGASRFNITGAGRQEAMAGLRMREVELLGNEGSARAGTRVGTLHADWQLPDQWTARAALAPLPLKSGGTFIAYPDNLPPFTLDFRELSPVTFDTVTWQAGQLVASGQLAPSLPLLGAPLTVTMRGQEITFSLTYSAGEIRLPIPGVQIDDAALTVLYSTTRGFGAMGNVDFSVPRLGSGVLQAGVTTTGGFEASGRFEFDSTLFDRAEIEVWYRQGLFGAAGEIGIDSPDRVRGIRAANLAVRFEQGGAVSATGMVQPSIPGVQEAGLTVAYSEAEGLTIGGTLALAENRAIRSGSIDVTLRKPDDRWRVQANGRAVPAIPGLDSELEVHYDDGAFDARFAGTFRRGMLAGSVEAGATNRTLDEAGQPTGPASSSVRLVAPWLQGTAGIRFAPDGEVTVRGEIGLPSSLSLFDRRQIDRQLFGLSVQVPIVPGIVAEVGGNLSATAGIGPGQLDQLRIGIEYTPSREQDTHVTGDAHLSVPADAGLRLAARAGIGLGITGASATGGIELGGTAGIAGAAEAGVHIDWRPSTGLSIEAEGYLHAEPRFRFDVSGYVSVQALGFSVYDERYELAAFELGSNLRLGVRFPVRYREGQPFDVSLDDVVFEVPPVDPMALVQDVIGQVA